MQLRERWLALTFRMARWPTRFCPLTVPSKLLLQAGTYRSETPVPIVVSSDDFNAQKFRSRQKSARRKRVELFIVSRTEPINREKFIGTP